MRTWREEKKSMTLARPRAGLRSQRQSRLLRYVPSPSPKAPRVSVSVRLPAHPADIT